MWYLYILLCDNKEFYAGITSNLQYRIKQHKDKQSLFTRRYSSIKLAYHESFQSKKDAEKREKQIKDWSKAKKKTLVLNDKSRLQQLSRSTEHG